jgi:4-amino-4-deoxy-L-arabinose transferase-like glycosyltransferase
VKGRFLSGSVSWWDAAALATLVALLAFYIVNLTSWRIFDDEGEYLYQVWRMTLGEAPYRDFLTPQLPAFLYSGFAVMSLAGPSLMAMRLFSIGLAFASAALLYIAGRKHNGPTTGLIAMVLFLLHADVFRETRVFRNEPLFVFLITAGLVVATWTAGEKKRRNVAISGVFFGLATMTKLFGLLPAAGISLWLLFEWWLARKQLKELILDALALALPLFGTLALFFLVFSALTPEFADLVVGHHVAQGSQLPFLEVIADKLDLFWRYFSLYAVLLSAAVASAVLGFANRDSRRRWAWQLVTVLAFVFLSRQFGQGHFMYLLPSVVLLAGWLLATALSGSYRWWGRVAGAAALVIIVFPWMQLNIDRASWVDTETEAILAKIAEGSEQGSAILADDIFWRGFVSWRSNQWANNRRSAH